VCGMSGRIPDAWLDELRARLNIVDVVSDYVQLKPKGRRYWGLCPFHNEKTASFSVDSEGQMYYCFGCHKGGTVINFVMEMERMEFLDAVKLLAERARIALPDSSDQPAVDRTLKERVYAANLAAARYFHDALWASGGAKILAYLHARGLDDGDIRRFGLGAASEEWDDLTNELIRQGFEEEVLVKAGLTMRKGEKRFDMFRGRAIFPIIDGQGRVLGFGGRAMGDAQPKYLNTPDSPVFNKRQNLYAINFVRKERSLDKLILVEGYMDAVALRRAGVQGVVATLGTALTEEQARIMKRYAPEVWVAYDGDAPGQKATLRALEILEAAGIPCRALVFPDGLDPDDFIRREGLEGFERLKPIGRFDYRMNSVAGEYDLTTQDGRTGYAIKCCEILRKVESPVELENYLARLTVETGFARDILLSQIGARPQLERRKPERRFQPKPVAETETQKCERQLLLLLSRNLIPRETVKPEDFDTPLYARMAKQFLAGASVASVIDQMDEDERQAAARALADEVLPDEKTAMQIAEDSLNKIRKNRMEAALNLLQEELATAGEARRRELIQQMSALTQELGRLRTGRKEWTV
jgi:DNA primase